jgi:8-oxo-dGTP pyrophosphatase MutT (NUDIX family)
MVMEPIVDPFVVTSILVIGVLLSLMVLFVVVLRIGKKERERKEIRSVVQGKHVNPEAIIEDQHPPLPGPWIELRDEVEASNRTLSRAVFEKARQIYVNHYSGVGDDTPEALTREYAREEFLMVLDEHGRPVHPHRLSLDQYTNTVKRHPGFERWFRKDSVKEGDTAGAAVLLAARWLCHLVGLRHGTVEIFLDPPNTEGQTLVQVRAIEKFESPGAFDIPCAGHIDGTDTVEDSLAKELGEELNLTLDDLENLRLLCRYNSFGEESPNHTINNEHRVLYRARLKPHATARIRFMDGEVAGLTTFDINELRALVRQYPERVASGLSEAIGYYE